MSPYEIMDQIEQEFGLATYPILWPIGDGERFKGVLDRMNNVVHLFDRGDRKSKAEVEQVSMSDLETLRKSIDDDELYEKLLEDQELLVELIPPLDMDRVMSGEQSPLFFGSAMTNFGVQLFLDKFCDMGTKPSGRLATRKEEVKGNKAESDNEVDELISPDHGEFSGFVFKTQANLDPKHRDRLAYIRIVSGKFEKGMKVGHSRSKPGKKFNLAQAQTLFGSDRESVEVAYPGDVIGINNPGDFAIGYDLLLCLQCTSDVSSSRGSLYYFLGTLCLQATKGLRIQGFPRFHPRFLHTSVIVTWKSISPFKRASINCWQRVPCKHFVSAMTTEAGPSFSLP